MTVTNVATHVIIGTKRGGRALLGVCYRSFRRYMCRYEELGMDGLLDQRLNTPSHLRAPRRKSWHCRICIRAATKARMCTTFMVGINESMKRLGIYALWLGIQMIAAYSPQARGRSERAFATHQGRLPRELALNGITNIDAANEYLKQHYTPRFNAEFSHQARETGSAFVPLMRIDLEDYLCERV